MKAAVVGAGIAAVLFGFLLGLAVISDSSPAGAALDGNVCATTGPIPGLSSAAATNARLVAAAAEPMGGERAALIAVVVGYTESGLRILGNPAVDTGGVPTEGTGTDHDSIGIFQQRPKWGTVAQRLDPVVSTELFIARLVKDLGWANKPPWVAAQDVQRSAYDGKPRPANHGSDVYGGNYAANLPLANRIVTEIESDAARHPCGTLRGGIPANTAPGSHGLPDAYRIPSSATPAEARVVAFALAQLDKPYMFGAAGPDAYDCSGLTMTAWATVGVRLPHSTTAQAGSGTPTTTAALLPGDLVLVAGDDGTLAAPGHVGLYLGDGLVVNAADERDGIRVQTYQNFIAVGHGLSALRHIE